MSEVPKFRIEDRNGNVFAFGMIAEDVCAVYRGLLDYGLSHLMITTD